MFTSFLRGLTLAVSRRRKRRRSAAEPKLEAVGSTAMLAWPDVGQQETSSPQRQIAYLAFPLPWQTALSQ
jgi:hypothetical protein